MARGKTICFIDNSNVFLGGRDAGWTVDWDKFQNFVSSTDPVWQIHFFASEKDPPIAVQKSFYQFIKNTLRWELHLYDLGRKTTKCLKCGDVNDTHTEKGVDVGLATKMLILGLNKAYDTALLVSGDKDYLETVAFLKNQGLRVEIISWKKSISPELATESSSSVIYFDDLKAQLEKI
jgi:uncharacterized LabA/DUF88 family protein